MSNIYHEGELYIQSKMGVNAEFDNLITMVRKDMPFLAHSFLKNLNFCVIVLSTNEKDIFSSVIYGIKQFIKIEDDMHIIVNLENHSFISESFFDGKLLNVGFLGIDFELARRIRINGKAEIKNNRIFIKIEELYSNCPKYINKRILKGQINQNTKKEISQIDFLDDEIRKIITNCDTFFLASFHKYKGLDISHKGGKKGFLKINSHNTFEFIDKKGNNVYNTLGNIHINPYVSMLFIDFDKNNTYHIFGNAKISEVFICEKKYLKVTVTCINIVKNTNSFLLNYI